MSINMACIVIYVCVLTAVWDCWCLTGCRQGILADKDSVIVELKQQAKNLREDLNMANIDSDRKSVALLTKVCLYLFTDFVHLCT